MTQRIIKLKSGNRIVATKSEVPGERHCTLSYRLEGPRQPKKKD